MNHQFKIVNSEPADLPFIFGLFEHSIAYQETKGFPVWRNYDKNAIVRDIENKNHYKAVSEEGIGIVFSVAYSDKVIWRERDQSESVYLHRIVVNPAFKGQRLFGLIVEWAINHIRQKGLKTIRMDTWAVNLNIVEYYKSFGFEVVENYTTPDTDELPVHNRKLALTLMEFKGS